MTAVCHMCVIKMKICSMPGPGVVDLAIRFAADGSRTMRRFRAHQRVQVGPRRPAACLQRAACATPKACISSC